MDLTDRTIRGLKPGKARYFESDGGAGGRRGLYVGVLPSGRRFFRGRVWVDGEEHLKVFEPDYPELGLADARETFDTWARDVRRRATTNTTAARRTTVADLLDEWDRAYLKEHRKHADGVVRAIQKDVVPRIGKMLVADVTRRDLVLVVDQVLERGSKRMADMLRSLLMQMFSFAVERGLIDDSPARLLPRIKRGRHAATRERVLDDKELRAFWWATEPNRDVVPEKYRAQFLPRVAPYTKRALRLLLLTGMRRSEVVEARWSELDLAARVWTVPAERTKSGREHVLPLSDFAIEILEEQRELTDGREFVFASPRAKFEKPLLPSAVSQAVNDNVAKIATQPFTPHDLRRTLRSRLSALGVDAIVSRKVVNHVLDGMDAIYDRHDYLKEKRDALQRWADALRVIIVGDPPAPSNVVRLPRRAR